MPDYSSDALARLYVTVETLTRDRTRHTTGPRHYLNAALNPLTEAICRELRLPRPWRDPFTDNYVPLPASLRW